jgi:hypothetical protein
VKQENKNVEEIYEVVYPIGKQATQEKDVAASLPDLNGKTICELWNYAFRGDDSFPMIEKFGNIHDPSEEAKMMAELPGKLKKFKCDAVIAGNGG